MFQTLQYNVVTYVRVHSLRTVYKQKFANYIFLRLRNACICCNEI